MKILTSKWFKITHWFIVLVPFTAWLYIWLFIGIANTNIDDICYPLSIVLFVTIIIKKSVLAFISESKQTNCNNGFIKLEEPRFLLDKDSQCYGCPYYKEKFECIQDHTDDDFDSNMGTCDVDCICVGGSMNSYQMGS